jgi:hypothetical protein
MLDSATLAAMPELWEPIAGWEGLYEVSTHGRVRSLDRPGRRGRILKPFGKYLAVTLNADGFQLDRSVHRIVAETFIPNPDDLPLVRHLDDDRSNNNVFNLEWGTQADNMADARRNGTRPTRKPSP